MGALGAFPGARGVVADLGGGSLELVSGADNSCHEAASLQLGTLRLDSNQLSGTVPTETGRLTQLYRLSLYNNQLSGTLPTELNMINPTYRCWLATTQCLSLIHI